MNFCLPFTQKDKEQAQRWLTWVEELGGMGRHRLFLTPFKGLAADFKTSIPFTLIPDEMGIVTDWADAGEIRCAAGANSMIRQIAWFMLMKKMGPWFFMEPDAIPLVPDWHDRLEAEYRSCGKPFMGALVPGKEPFYSDHMTGNGVYPQDAVAMSRGLALPHNAVVEGSTRRVELAFDVAAAPDIVPRMHNTKLIQHVFRGPAFYTAPDLTRINPETVLWHSDKDGGLIRLLRAKRNGKEVSPLPEPDKVNRPRVHTYFRPCIDTDALAEQKAILDIWQENWKQAGWEPVILTEADARRHPEYEKYASAFRAMPTVNPKEYEMAAWTRWIAMSLIGMLMVDYDTLNNGFTAFDADITLRDYPSVLSNLNPVPCAVFGEKEQYQNAIDAFLTCKPGKEGGKPHLSDQLAVQQLKFDAMDVCKEVGKAGWKNAKLIHFSHAACGKQKRSAMMSAWAKSRNGNAGEQITTEDIIEAVIEAVPEQSRPPNSAYHIEELVKLSKKDGFAKGRIVKQLRKAGLIK